MGWEDFLVEGVVYVKIGDYRLVWRIVVGFRVFGEVRSCGCELCRVICLERFFLVSYFVRLYRFVGIGS